ncbi:hypothetical protein QTP70_011141 [Hemibagrus guttatus]|uniref:ribonuclease H n=1 Tax=Hemibagrus guttatus TaxID=175788 RepID=A0AAE0UHW0_9TELE|nr:hypothetical protein QTP70_011141 [Hemibagrus guttatus]
MEGICEIKPASSGAEVAIRSCHCGSRRCGSRRCGSRPVGHVTVGHVAVGHVAVSHVTLCYVTVCHATLGHFTVGHVTVGHVALGLVAVGHVTVGHVAVGHIAVGHVTVGHVAVGHVAVGHGTLCYVTVCHATVGHVAVSHVTLCYVTVCHATLGHVTVGHIAVGHVAVGHVAVGHGTLCYVTVCHATVGHVTVSHVTVGHIAVGHVSVGHVAVGHVAVGHVTVCHATVSHVTVGHIAVGHVTLCYVTVCHATVYVTMRHTSPLFPPRIRRGGPVLCVLHRRKRVENASALNVVVVLSLCWRIVSTNFIPDRSKPGLTTTTIGAVDLQGAGGNWATVGRRSRGGRRVHRQREKRKGKSVGLRIGTLNVGTMTGKGRELADVMERRKVDILCVQETRWKGSKARSIGAGFKLFYYGVDSKRNGVGVVLKEEFVRNVLEVKRVSDRVMSLKLEIEGVMLNVVSGYAPQVGCELEEKERFWSELDEVMESIPTGERVVIGADFNGHVGEGNTGDEEVMGKFGVKERNLEGQMVVDFAKRMDMGVVNTYFQKREEHRVTYKSGGRSTQVDYILCRRGNLKEISDCKVVVGESVARQHRMVVCRMTLMVCKKKRSKIEIEKKTKWWKLKKEECCEEFRQKLRQALGGQVLLPDDWETTAEVIRETGRKVLGVSSGRRKEDKETWWWNEEVQDSIQRKRFAKKKWDMDRTEENRQECKELQRRVRREVSKAKQKAYDELYTRLDTREGQKDLYRLARQRDRDGKDVQQVRVIKDRDGRVLTSEESVQRRWKEYFEELMNEENEREKRVEGVNSVEQEVDKIRKDEVRKALKRMKSGKAVGPDDIPVEVWKCLGEAAVEFLASLFNRVLESERMPEEWRRSVLVPIFKNKGDVQSCSNYRGIKLMSHTMKLWERVVEARLRKVVEICEQQYGFMPRKSTTDAIFALRILIEKYRDGQRELHCVFVDLEKAYDRVPREELWYCMRKPGVAEKYVRVVQDMYERSRTVVRCAVGQTEEFNVKVGLHQGSALSPFLFAIVMDQLSEEVRQESPWTMMFADDIVICSESREQVEENLERWRFALERRGMKVSRSKTEYMCVNEREGSGTVRLQGEEVKKVQEFKYLGSTVQSNGECGKEVKKRVQAGWNGWRKVWGVLCDRKISARIKGKVYRTVVRPAMLYGLETVSLRKRQESELEVAELKMLRFSLGVKRLDRIRNEYIRGTAHVGRLGDKVREVWTCSEEGDILMGLQGVHTEPSPAAVTTTNLLEEFIKCPYGVYDDDCADPLREDIKY